MNKERYFLIVGAHGFGAIYKGPYFRAKQDFYYVKVKDRPNEADYPTIITDFKIRNSYMYSVKEITKEQAFIELL